VPVAQKHRCITAFFLSFGCEPLDEFQTVFIVLNTVGLQPKVNIGADCNLAE
jgi:hypothetical protein